MGTASRTRPGQARTSGYNVNGPLKDWPRRVDTHTTYTHSQNNRSRPTRSAGSTTSSPLVDTGKLPSPSTVIGIGNPVSPAQRGARQRDSTSSSEDIAAEIVVWTESMNDTMSLDSDVNSASESPDALTPVPEVVQPVQSDGAIGPVDSPDLTPAAPSPSLPNPVSDGDSNVNDLANSAPEPEAMDVEPVEAEHVEINIVEAPAVETENSEINDVEMRDIKPEAVDTVDERGPLLASSLSIISEPSDLSSIPPASQSSKATTPIDVDSSKDAPAQIIRPSRTVDTHRRRYNVRPKVSIPPDLPLPEYAMECISAAESSRLNPYALHQEEYLILQDHISHAQVTTYLNIRNGILRLWVRNPQIAVTREEAVGCAKDARWFDVASVCFDWLVRRGYINFGCVEIRSSKRHSKDHQAGTAKRKTVVVIGAGMAGLGCARQLEGLFLQYSKRFRERGEEMPEVVLLEGRNRVGGRVYSRPFASRPRVVPENFEGKRFTAEMGGMIITGFERGNPINILLRGQLGLPYRPLRPDTTLYDSNGKPVDLKRDQLVEKLYNDCLDRVSEYKFKQPTSKLIEGNRELMDEGKDSSSEATKTIRQAEESTAAQPHSLPVAEQSIAPQVNLVPVSSDRATGRIHTEPGTPGAFKAAYKAKLMGWALKQGVTEADDLDIEALTKDQNATLGSVMDNIIAQYKDLVDLNAQDYRLMNWHIANLEYSNATNYNQLSLQGWDIDAGNEWEGHHTMVIGGYQSVPRGLLQFPTPLNIRQKSPVSKITYASGGSTGPAVVECEDGYKIEADYVVNTIPLGVLKHGSIKFEPPLPSWKSDAIGRLGFGVLNKVIMVYKEPFWDEDRDIFGVLRNPQNRHSLDQKDYASQRGRFFQWFDITQTSGLPVLLALMAGDAGYDTEQSCNDDLVREATDILRSVYGSKVPEPIETVVTRWASDKFARGSYSSAGPDMKADDYDAMARPIGNLFFAGEHTSGTHPATVHGAYLSGLRAASEVLDSLLGPLEIPTPLIIPRDSSSSSSLKRKATDPTTNNPSAPNNIEAYEIATWNHVIEQIGLRPLKPSKLAVSAYIFYSKAHYEDARKQCEVGRRPGKGKPSGNEIRVMSAKMWRDLDAEAKRPFEEMAEEQKRIYAGKMAEFNVAAGEWDRRATEIRVQWEREHPRPGGGGGEGGGELRELGDERWRRRRGRRSAGGGSIGGGGNGGSQSQSQSADVTGSEREGGGDGNGEGNGNGRKRGREDEVEPKHEPEPEPEREGSEGVGNGVDVDVTMNDDDGGSPGVDGEAQVPGSDVEAPGGGEENTGDVHDTVEKMVE